MSNASISRKKIQKIIVKIEKIIVLSIWVFIHIIIDLLKIFFDIIESEGEK